MNISAIWPRRIGWLLVALFVAVLLAAQRDRTGRLAAQATVLPAGGVLRLQARVPAGARVAAGGTVLVGCPGTRSAQRAVVTEVRRAGPELHLEATLDMPAGGCRIPLGRPVEVQVVVGADGKLGSVIPRLGDLFGGVHEGK